VQRYKATSQSDLSFTLYIISYILVIKNGLKRYKATSLLDLNFFIYYRLVKSKITAKIQNY
jgi:hypothetical protein